MSSDENSGSDPLTMVIKVEPEEFEVFTEGWEDNSLPSPPAYDDSNGVKVEFLNDLVETKSRRSQFRDPIYELYTLNDDLNVAFCQQGSCSAKLAKKATNLKRHLQRFHKSVYETFIKTNKQTPAKKKSFEMETVAVKKTEVSDLCAEIEAAERSLKLFESETKRMNDPKPTKVLRGKSSNPVYDLFDSSEDPSVAHCQQEGCSAKLANKANTLNKHLFRFHKSVYKTLTEPSNQSQPTVVKKPTQTIVTKPIATKKQTPEDKAVSPEVAMDVLPFSLFDLPKLNGKRKAKKRKDAWTTRSRSLNPVYGLFDSTEDPNVAHCKQEGCSAKLANKANTLNRHLFRFHKSVYKTLTETRDKSQEPTDTTADQTLDTNETSEDIKKPIDDETLDNNETSEDIEMPIDDNDQPPMDDVILDDSAEIEDEIQTVEPSHEKARKPEKKTKARTGLDPVYDLFSTSEKPNVVFCQQGDCSAKLLRKASTLKRHLRRLHMDVFKTLTESSTLPTSNDIAGSNDNDMMETSAENAIDKQISNVPKPKIKKKKTKLTKERRRDPVYDLFSFEDDPNVATCTQESCCAKLAKKATTLKRHLERFHTSVFEIPPEASDD